MDGEMSETVSVVTTDTEVAAEMEGLLKDGMKRRTELDGNGENAALIKIIGPNDEDIYTDDFIKAPDGGWGWVIVFAAFISNLIVDGTLFSWGILLTSIEESSKEKVSSGKLGLVGGILSGFYLMAGPFASVIANIIGFRLTAITGSFVAFLGLTATWAFNIDGDTIGINVDALLVCYGFIAGVGFCLLYVPSLVMVGYYFEKRRALATGIAVCGSGCGTFIYAPLVQYLIKMYGWPNTILIEGFLFLLLAFIGLLYRPLNAVKRVPLPEDVTGEQLGNIIPLGETTKVIIRVGSIEETLGVLASGTSIAARSNERIFSAHKINPNSTQEMPASPIVQPVETENEIHPKVVSLQNTLSQSSVRNDIVVSSHSLVRTVTLVLDGAIPKFEESRIFRVASKSYLNKPLNRSDVFYAGNPGKIIEADNEDKGYKNLEWEAVLVPKIASAVVEKRSKCKFNCRCQILKKMLDISILKSPSFILFTIAGGIAYLAFFVPFIYLKGIAIENGISDTNSTNLIMAIGIANTVGRVICGLFADKLINYVFLINNLALITGGVATLLVPLMETYTVFMIYSVIFGLSIAFFVSLRSILIVELMGLSKLANAMGFLFLFEGLASFIGSPVAAYLKDYTGNFKVTFYVVGSLMLFSGLMGLPLKIVNTLEKHHQLMEKVYRREFQI